MEYVVTLVVEVCYVDANSKDDAIQQAVDHIQSLDSVYVVRTLKASNTDYFAEI